ncbi:MAG: 6,7-dimethyl-8-ribityllumazine synthase [Prevotella sp.]|nr:6,7-dimethyl-8-ribityllumazine synthase [Prevotella sp.]MCM1074981.1 6,7-dimethyl-8-ribityllumazine synthase [Ruminococcus sp.]
MTNEANQNYEVATPADARKFRCAVCVATWNEDITGSLLQGALEAFKLKGVPQENVTVIRVPGSVELVNAAAFAINTLKPDAVVVLGCVIRGETPHFDYVCESVTQGVTLLNAKGETPVIFGLVTTENLLQAQERAGGRLGNKGTEAASAAIAMANIHATIKSVS